MLVPDYKLPVQNLKKDKQAHIFSVVQIVYPYGSCFFLQRAFWKELGSGDMMSPYHDIRG